MTPRLRRLSAREVLRALHGHGFEVVATRGSHAKLRRTAPDGYAQILTVPLHNELAPGTLRASVHPSGGIAVLLLYMTISAGRLGG
jgi:predicted RNA binding protein YcfA (HicA-like mRNA interferase family)